MFAFPYLRRVAVLSGICVLLSPSVSAAVCTSSLIPAAASQTGDTFNSVAGLTTSDVWAVGTTAAGVQTLAEHSSGSAFAVVQSPNVPGYPSALNSVAEVASNDAWAVGTWSGYDVHELIEHWNGSTWRFLPKYVHTFWNLQSVSALANDAQSVWAVGYIEQHYCRNPLGCNAPVSTHFIPSKGWASEPVPIPRFAPYGGLFAVASVTGGTAWAVGWHGVYSNPQQLIEHWNGRRWSVVRSGPDNGILTAVTALSDTDVWVGGYKYRTYPTDGDRLIEHWNGSAWTTYKLPLAGGTVTSISAQSDNDVWAAGGAMTPPVSTNADLPLLEHFDGSSWSRIPTVADGLQTSIAGILDFSGQALWVGSALPAVNFNTIPVAAETHC